MKILFLPSWYPSKEDPIWGNYFLKQAESMSKYADVSMMYVNRVGIKQVFKFFKIKKEKPKEYKFKFFKTDIINLKSINIFLSYYFYKKAIYKLYKKNIKEKPDIIFVQSVLPAGVGALYISKKENIPFVVHEHSKTVMQNKKHKAFFEKILKEADGYFAVGKSIKEYLLEIGRTDTKIIPNFINTKKFDILPNKSKKDFTIITICNFFKIKSIEVLFKALRIFLDKYKVTNVKLNIIGTGENEEFYKQTVKKLNLNKYVNFLGYVKNDDVPKKLSESNILCLSSKEETFGIPIVEAMACGLPCISTNCSGPREIINKENGILVPIDDEKKYAEAIYSMYKNSNNYSSSKIKKFVYDNYDEKVVCNNILKELKIIIKRKKS